MPLRALPPQGSASANFATWAWSRGRPGGPSIGSDETLAIIASGSPQALRIPLLLSPFRAAVPGTDPGAFNAVSTVAIQPLLEGVKPIAEAAGVFGPVSLRDGRL